jgi:hypothetical protein
VNSVGEGPNSQPVEATPQAPPDTELPYSLWSFDEGTGTRTRDSMDASLSATLSSSSQWSVPGKTGAAAVKFSGQGDAVKAGSFAWSGGDPVTVSFWTKVNASEVRDSSSFWVGGQDGGRFQAHVPWSDGVLYWDYGSISGKGRISVPFRDYLGQWTLVTLVSAGVNGDFKGIYLNGQRVASSPVSDGPNTDKLGLRIGGGDFGGLRGLIDDFRIYRRVLDADEIEALFRSPSTVAQAGLNSLVARRKSSGVQLLHKQGGANLRLAFDGRPGQAYAIQTTENLSEPTWTTIGSAYAGSDGSVTLTVPLDERRVSGFYRAVTLDDAPALR